MHFAIFCTAFESCFSQNFSLQIHTVSQKRLHPLLHKYHDFELKNHVISGHVRGWSGWSADTPKIWKIIEKSQKLGFCLGYHAIWSLYMKILTWPMRYQSSWVTWVTDVGIHKGFRAFHRGIIRVCYLRGWKGGIKPGLPANWSRWQIFSEYQLCCSITLKS